MSAHTPGPWLADARLIAAAPDLLAALEEVDAEADFIAWPENVKAQARAAIAKAKGEA